MARKKLDGDFLFMPKDGRHRTSNCFSESRLPILETFKPKSENRMYSYVILWENNTKGHTAVKGHNWSGHAALNIGENFDHKSQAARNCYVSWWPEKSLSFSVLGILKSAVTPAQTALRSMSIAEDVESEEYLPDHVIRLPTDEGQERKMKAAWKEVYLPQDQKEIKYKAIRRNCSTIVSRILHAGGFESKKWSVQSHFAWSPADIRVLARKVGGKYIRWTDFVELLQQSNVNPDTWGIKQARSGLLCTTGAPCRFQDEGERSFFWKNK